VAEQLPYRRLSVWQRAFSLATDVLEFAESSEELTRRYYFRDQLCRSAMSVPANIAEGNGRGRPLDYASFIDRARGSLFELDTWLYAAVDRSYLSEARYGTYESEIVELSAMMLALRNSLRQQADHEAATKKKR
jgi:four helix bundle protein